MSNKPTAIAVNQDFDIFFSSRPAEQMTLADFHHSRFWKAHPEYWRVPGSVHAYADRALDYAIPAVRENHLRLIAELLDRYDIDGLELDWMRRRVVTFADVVAPGTRWRRCSRRRRWYAGRTWWT